MKLKRTKLKWKNINAKVALLKGFGEKYQGTFRTIKMDYCSFAVEGVLNFSKFNVECHILCINNVAFHIRKQ